MYAIGIGDLFFPNRTELPERNEYNYYFSLHRIEEEFSYREQVHNLLIFPLAAAERVVYNMKENKKTYDIMVEAKRKLKPSTRNETGNL